MPVTLTCPHCQASLKGPDEVVGKSIRCKKCETVFVAKAAAPPPAATKPGTPRPLFGEDEPEGRPRRRPAAVVEQDEDQDEEHPRPRRKKKHKSRTPLIVGLVAGCVGLVVLCGVGATGYYFLTRKTLYQKLAELPRPVNYPTDRPWPPTDVSGAPGYPKPAPPRPPEIPWEQRPLPSQPLLNFKLPPPPPKPVPPIPPPSPSYGIVARLSNPRYQKGNLGRDAFTIDFVFTGDRKAIRGYFLMVREGTNIHRIRLLFVDEFAESGSFQLDAILGSGRLPPNSEVWLGAQGPGEPERISEVVAVN